MKNMNVEIRNKILDFLKDKPFGASSSEISKKIGHNRITVTKYLEIMRANKTLLCEGVAQAKLWRIKEKDERPTVLIVDDEPNVVDLVGLSLISGKYKILKAYSGLDALEKVYQETPDIIILDLMMPGVDGYEVCRKLKESASTQHIPIIILSAKGELTDKLKGIKIGADDYITKPFDPMELEARVNAVLRRVKQDIDMHPLTKLPGRESIEMQVKKQLKAGKEFYLFIYQIRNLDDFAEKYGFRRLDDIVLLISRVFADAVNESGADFLAHTLRDSFVVVAPSEDIDRAIKSGFKRVLPYIYSKGLEDKHLELDSKKIKSSQLTKKSADLAEIFDKR